MPEIKINKVNIIEYWSWLEDVEEVCPVCTLYLNDTCPKCDITGERCIPVQGPCKHYYHLHCITEWAKHLEYKPTCPLCRSPFLLDELIHFVE